MRACAIHFGFLGSVFQCAPRYKSTPFPGRLFSAPTKSAHACARDIARIPRAYFQRDHHFWWWTFGGFWCSSIDSRFINQCAGQSDLRSVVFFLARNTHTNPKEILIPRVRCALDCIHLFSYYTSLFDVPLAAMKSF